MRVSEIEARTLLSGGKPDPWFGIKYTMNLYRGCQHQALYDALKALHGFAQFVGPYEEPGRQLTLF